MSQIKYFMNPNFFDLAVKNANTFINGGSNWTNVRNVNYQNKTTPI